MPIRDPLTMAVSVRHRAMHFHTLRRGLRPLKGKLYALYSSSFPFLYKQETYFKDIEGLSEPESYSFPVNHLAFDSPLRSSPAPQREPVRAIWCFWTGDNPVTANRRRSLAQIQETSPELPVRLITLDNLAEIVIPNHPLHPAFLNLSFIHRSDYLRAYVMHHHGGAYADVKPTAHDWSPVFDEFTAGDKWMVGRRDETYPLILTPSSGVLGRHERAYFRTIPGLFNYICRPNTALTHEWLLEVERRMSYFADLLQQTEPTPFGGADYAVPWHALNVATPLFLKYHDHVGVDERLAPGPSQGGYR